MADRSAVIARLREDLIGPHKANEILPARPTDVYLTGILWPPQAGHDPEADDQLGMEDGESGDSGELDAVRGSAMTRPSTAGISFAVRSTDGAPQIQIEVNAATYELVDREATQADSVGSQSLNDRRVSGFWRRIPHCVLVSPVVCAERSTSIDLRLPTNDIVAQNVGGSSDIPNGVTLHLRAIAWQGQSLVTVTLVNQIQPTGKSRSELEEATLFQTQVRIRPLSGTNLVARPVRRGSTDGDRADDLLYAHAQEFAVGHTCGADWTPPTAGQFVGEVRSEWMPLAQVATVSSLGSRALADLAQKASSPLDAEWLAKANVQQMIAALMELPAAYRNWMSEKERELLSIDDELKDQARAHLKVIGDVASSIEDGIKFIESDAVAARAFQVANQAMALQFSWSKGSAGGGLRWRPFQLGFVLLTIPSLVDRTHPDRQIMDLLWFPTGGGKTEAYLALIAFLSIYRRLKSGDTDDRGGGVSAIMRYTLRLLTTQQFERAASMIMACEVLRRRQPEVFGPAPFSIGLWVGGDATPNSYEVARESLATHRPDIASPRQLLKCPRCSSQLDWAAHDGSRRIEARCLNRECEIGASQDVLPVWTVDEDVYREQPTLLLGTVDKFAQIVRGSAWRSLFGLDGGKKPDLIIQDELHLISGPLGTVAGLYEAAIDRLLEVDGIPVKVIGSTATIRRAQEQILAVFNRNARLFPPPGLSAHDSGFAVRDDQSPGRIFSAVTTAGRSAKFALQAVAASLLQSGAVAFRNDEDADPYKTLVTYFNSLRELGGALVLMQDDVSDSIRMYADLRNESPRAIEIVEELTSRRSQTEIRDMLGKLAISARQNGMLDVVLASNMLSVGVDVPRLALMLVNGQPKGIAEYIQATSRVGRGKGSGLVVAVLNNAKNRDRSHFETFRTWHETLYRDVEATSVTPFSARARDRALHAVLVALIRNLVPGLVSVPDLSQATDADIRSLRDWIIDRGKGIDPSELDIGLEIDELIAEWERRSPSVYWNDFKPNQSLLQSAERVAMRRAVGRSPGAAWPTMNNMRSVEPSTHFRLAEALRARAVDRGSDANGQ